MSILAGRTATPSRIGVATLRDWLGDGAEIALLDVREFGEYGSAHLFFAVNVPYSVLETEARRLVPRLTTRIVLCDDGRSGVAEKAASRLAAQGYTDVSLLDGGTDAWQAAGHVLYAGVNLPSKTLGELVEARLHTPSLQPQDLQQRLDRGDDLIVLDGRPFAEYQKMNIPGALNCPNGELALRAATMAASPETTIVVNCAGRTRSIIGAQTLINLGLPNPVYALENGTQGWLLADLTLEHGSQRRYPDELPPEAISASRERVQALAEKSDIRIIDAETLARFIAEDDRTTYLCDVRTPDEFSAGTRSGAVSTPGGQLLQATDLYLGTRGARVVLFDTEMVRAPTIASWMRTLGWDVYVLASDAADIAVPQASPPALPVLPLLGVDGLAALLGTACIIDLRASAAYRSGHLEWAKWSIRPRLDRDVCQTAGTVVLVVDAPDIARMAALDLPNGSDRLFLHIAAVAGWRAAGLPVVSSTEIPPDDERIDFLFFTHDRHDGNKAAARQYLAWEMNLLSQIDELERGSYALD